MPRPKLLIATHNPGKVREFRALLGGVPFELVSLNDAAITEEIEETGDTFEENARLKACGYAALSGLTTLADDSGLEVDALDGQPGVRSARYGEETVDKDASRKLSDQDRVTLLLRNLDGVRWDRRTARFRCVIAVANPPSSCHSDAHTSSHSDTHSPCHSDTHSPCHSEKRSDEESKMPRPQHITVAQDHTPIAVPPSSHDQFPASEVTFSEGSVEGVIQYEPMGKNGFGYDPVFYLPSYGLTMAQLPLEEKNRISHRAQAALKTMELLQRWHEFHPEGH